jgi:MscS family membrane protein
VEFWNTMIWDNEAWRWIAYLTITVFSLMLSRVLFHVVRRIVQAFTKKTETKVDDIVLDAVERPTILALVASSLYFGLFLIRHDEGFLATTPLVLGIYGFVVTVLVTFVLAKLYGDLLEYYLRPIVEKTETKLDDQLLPIGIKGGKLAIWSVGLMIAFSNAGVDVNSLIAGLGIGGLAFAMAAKDTVANIFGGASIFADKPFQIGDVITVSGNTGTVEEIGVRTTRIRTFEDTVFILPNAQVADSPLENLSARTHRRRILSIGLTYEHSAAQLREAKALLAEILAETEGLDPEPAIRFDEFGDSALLLKAIYWVSDPDDYWVKLDEVNMKVLERFAAAGFDMAFPTQTVYVKKDA